MEAFVKSHNTRKKVAVACAHDDVTLEAVLMAVDKQVAQAILIGKKAEIETLLREAGKEPEAFEILDEADERAAIDKAVAMVRGGQADIPMKGLSIRPRLCAAFWISRRAFWNRESFSARHLYLKWKRRAVC